MREQTHLAHNCTGSAQKSAYLKGEQVILTQRHSVAEAQPTPKERVVQSARSVPPHPSPLPRGEGAMFGHQRKSSRNSMICRHCVAKTPRREKDLEKFEGWIEWD